VCQHGGRATGQLGARRDGRLARDRECLHVGNGVLLWSATDDFDTMMKRVTDNEAIVLDGPLVNPNAGHREVWLLR
jgi:hypothetical protein